MNKKTAWEISEALWTVIGPDSFEELAQDELNDLFDRVEKFQAAIQSKRDDPFFEQLHYDCELMRFFILGEGNYKRSGEFF